MNRNLKLNVAGCMSSALANTLYNFCTSLFILDITKSAIHMSVFMAYSMLLGVIIQPLLGVYIEKKSKVKVMYITDTIFAFSDILLGILLFFSVSNKLIFVCLYMNATINTIMNSMCEPASAALVPLIVEKEDLHKAYSIFSLTGNIVNIFGIIFASTLYVFISYKWILILNGCLVGVSSILERFICVDEEFNEENNSEGYFKQLTNGFKYLLNRKVLAQITLCAVIVNIFLCGVFSTVCPFLYNNVLQLPSFYLGSVQVAMSIGSMGIAFLLSKNQIKKKGRLIFTGFIGQSVSLLILFASYTAYSNLYFEILYFHIIYCIVACIMGVFSVLIQIPVNIIYATNVESEYMGRVMAIRKTLSTISAPLGLLVFGICLEQFHVNTVLLIGVIGMVFSTLVMSTQKQLLKS